MNLIFVSCANNRVTVTNLSEFEATSSIDIDLSKLEPMSSLDSLTYLSTLKLGVNISSSFDAYPYNFPVGLGNYSETAWGNPVINQALLDGIAAAGFDIIRLPITWTGFIGDAPNYEVSESRLSRVAEVVDMAHLAGLKVIINTHHDDGSFNGKFYDTAGWLRVDKAASNRTEYTRITAMFQAVWRQIAEYFVYYGDYLIFESFNELANANWSPVGRERAVINEWNQLFVDTVRSTGGNNEKRFLILPGYAGKGEYLLGNFVLPKDTKNSDKNKLIVAFHYYDPNDFTTQGKQLTWGTRADKAVIDTLFKNLNNNFINKNIPVILDEFGVRYNSAIENTQKDYLSYVVGAASKYGMPALFWDDSNPYSGFMLFNRITGRLFPFMESYVQAMKNAVNKEF